MLSGLKRILALLDRLVEWLLAALMVSLLGIILLQFVDRHFVDTGIAAPDQYARLLLVWLCFVGFAIAVRGDVNIRVDLIDAHLPAKLRHVLQLAFDALFLVLLAVLVPGTWRLMEIGKDQERLGTIFSEAVPALGVFIACLLMLVYIGTRLAVRLLGGELLRSEER